MTIVETIATGLFAVFGTLLGVLATYWVQKSTVKQQEDLAREERLRQDRVSAYTVFAGALTSYRHSRMDRFFAGRGENRLDPELVRHETFHQRCTTSGRTGLRTHDRWLKGMTPSLVAGGCHVEYRPRR
ncbi:hypothetical protein [Promicromonospora sp. NPDC019610]|uniref:hypothetical protein n=1 Tax=Promicromonospora sp. NPDC019610 TaxID=3364405 RepID=UPI0037B3D1A5